MSGYKLPTIAAAAALIAAPSFAASTASASIGPLSMRLIDLDRTDGVPPTIAFSSAQGSYVYTTARSTLPTVVIDGGSAVGEGAFSPLEVNGETPFAVSAATIFGNGGARRTTISASGSAEDFFGPSPYDPAQFEAMAELMPSFMLSTNTAVVFWGQASISAAASTINNPFGDSAGAFASAYMTLWGAGASGGGGSQSAADFIEYESYAAFNYSETRMLSVSFVNVSGGDLEGNLYIGVQASGFSLANSPAAPVPEPATGAALLAGLAAVGLVTRRKRN